MSGNRTIQIQCRCEELTSNSVATRSRRQIPLTIFFNISKKKGLISINNGNEILRWIFFSLKRINKGNFFAMLPDIKRKKKDDKALVTSAVRILHYLLKCKRVFG